VLRGQRESRCCSRRSISPRAHRSFRAASATSSTGGCGGSEGRGRADRALAGVDLLPDEHLVDASYVSVDGVLDARADHDVDLVGPLPPDSGWQARDERGFDLGRFRIDGDQRQVTCPNGKTGRNWRQGTSRHGLPIVQVTFRAPDCTPCPDRARCTRSPTNARHLTFRPRLQYETQHSIRAEQATDAWRERDAHRSGIEGTSGGGPGSDRSASTWWGRTASAARNCRASSGSIWLAKWPTCRPPSSPTRRAAQPRQVLEHRSLPMSSHSGGRRRNRHDPQPRAGRGPRRRPVGPRSCIPTPSRYHTPTLCRSRPLTI